jgi:ABC-type lipoprotein release transport system permease subunit
MLAASDIRRRWRSVVALTLLVGAVGAIVLATAAGARRSDTALTRFNRYSRSSDVEISIGTPTASQLKAFRRAPEIKAVALAHGYALVADNNEGIALAVPVDSALGNLVDRARVIKGRQANPAAPDEATVGEGLAAQMHLRVNGHLDAVSYTRAQVKAAFSGGQPGAPKGPLVRLRVVGIVRRPLDLGVRAAQGGIVMLTPAFTAKYAHRVGRFTDTIRVKTRAGTADVPLAVASARKLWGDAPTFGVQPLGFETEGAKSAIDVLTSAMWIFALVAALAGAVAVVIVLIRDVSHVVVDQSTLRSLGFTRGQRIAAAAAHAVFIAAGGALLAVLGAIAVSPRFPLGIARRADPDVGVHADWLVLGLGVALVAVAVLFVAFLGAWRVTRTISADRVAHASRTSPVVEAAARAGLRPPATSGLRMALQAGRGELSVPVRSAFAGAVLGVAGVTAALVFAASLTHLVATPRLAGWTWDLQTAVGDRPSSLCVDGNDRGLARVPGVEAVAEQCRRDIQVDGHPVFGMGFHSLRGTITPEIVAGRAPRSSREIALGSVTLNAIHKHIGQTVTVHGNGATRDFVIVGRVVLPSLSIEDLQPLADGASFSGAGIRRIAEEGANQTHFVLVKLAPGADREVVARRMKAIPESKDFGAPRTPVEINRLKQINWFPAILALLLATLALIAVGHALVTSVRRRRREIALLKTIGFDRRQVGATVAWQATTLGCVGLVAGLPLGLLLGREVWAFVADSLGISTVVSVPVISVVGTIAAVLVLVNLIAFFPARAAARTRPAVALRSE